MIEKIVSGGQTGVDRAALDAAINMGFSYGGWCPKGRIDERGVIPEKYDQLMEIKGEFGSEKENYDTRTKLNIRDSDGTLIIVPSLPLSDQIKDGTLLTIAEVSSRGKPFFLIGLSAEDNITTCVEWLKDKDFRILNIAGPRESTCEGIYQASLDFLNTLMPQLISSYSPCFS